MFRPLLKLFTFSDHDPSAGLGCAVLSKADRRFTEVWVTAMSKNGRGR